MPGLPIEPEIVSESETLNEVSPGTMNTLVDTDLALDLEVISGLETDETCTYEEAEVEAVEEELHEMEPPEEDQIEDFDIDTPIVKIIAHDNGESDEDEEDDEDNIGDDTNRSGGDANEISEEHDVDDNVDGDETEKNELTGQTEDVMDRLKVDADKEGDSDTDASNDKRESGEVFHDAIEGQGERNNTEITEDPGGNEIDNNINEVTKEGSENIEQLEKDNIETDTGDSENNYIEVDDSNVMIKQKYISSTETEENKSDIKNDDTVQSLSESPSSEQV